MTRRNNTDPDALKAAAWDATAARQVAKGNYERALHKWDRGRTGKMGPTEFYRTKVQPLRDKYEAAAARETAAWDATKRTSNRRHSNSTILTTIREKGGSVTLTRLAHAGLRWRAEVHLGGHVGTGEGPTKHEAAEAAMRDRERRRSGGGRTGNATAKPKWSVGTKLRSVRRVPGSPRDVYTDEALVLRGVHKVKGRKGPAYFRYEVQTADGNTYYLDDDQLYAGQQALWGNRRKARPRRARRHNGSESRFWFISRDVREPDGWQAARPVPISRSEKMALAWARSASRNAHTSIRVFEHTYSGKRLLGAFDAYGRETQS